MKFTTQVIRGQGRGKILGFPTLNLQIPSNFTFKPGIYAGYVWINCHQHKGAFHFGPIPVFHDLHSYLEVFVLDYNSDQLITRLTFELIHFLRPIRNFSSSQKLAHQISLDVAQVRATLN